MIALFDLVATYRLTRLVTADDLTLPLRDRIVRAAYERAGVNTGEMYHPALFAMAEDDDPPKLATLVTCRWCAGVWISLGVVVARRLCPRAWPPLARALTYSAGAALLARLEDE